MSLFLCHAAFCSQALPPQLTGKGAAAREAARCVREEVEREAAVTGSVLLATAVAYVSTLFSGVCFCPPHSPDCFLLVSDKSWRWTPRPVCHCVHTVSCRDPPGMGTLSRVGALAIRPPQMAKAHGQRREHPQRESPTGMQSETGREAKVPAHSPVRLRLGLCGKVRCCRCWGEVSVVD